MTTAAASSQIAMCQVTLEGGGLAARRSSSWGCLAGGAERSCKSRRHGLQVMAAQDQKGTRIFKFINKKEASRDQTSSETGTRTFRFGAKKKQEEEPQEEVDPKFGTQLFKNFAAPNKPVNKGAALVPRKDALAFSLSLPRRQDPKTVFVAGATGQIGARIVQKLLRQGFNVRGGVRDLFVAQQLAEFATQYGVVSREEAKRLNAVEFDFKSVESIAKAIGAAGKVVVTIGPTEDGPKSKVSFEDASNVVEAASLANSANLVVVYEPGTGGLAENPLAGLASFFSELFSKPNAVMVSELLSQIAESNMSYTLLKTSLTDGVDDISYDAQNIDLCKEGTPVSVEGSKISKGQVASIVAEVLANPGVAENKVIEAFTSSSAVVAPISQLLSAIPVDGRREALAAARAKAEEEEREKAAREKAEADARAAVEEARKAAQLAVQLEAEAKQLAAEEAKAASLAEKAQAQAAAASASVDSLASKIKNLPGPEIFVKAAAKAGSAALPSFSLPAFPSLSSAKATATPRPAAAAAPLPKKKQRESVSSSTPATASQKPQVNSIFGGLFTQETVYVDEL